MLRKFIKLLIISTEIIGLLIILSELINYPQNCRTKFVNKVKTLGEQVLSIEEECTDQFLNRFLFEGKTKYQSYLADMKGKVKGIVIENLLLNKSIVFGEVYLEVNDGRRRKLCTFQELDEWATKNTFQKWLGWKLHF